jgi:hypothetical protein
MPVTDGLLAGGCFVDGFERKGDFNELLNMRHSVFPNPESDKA